jgi:multiple sugar transport system ATP-binding protein
MNADFLRLEALQKTYPDGTHAVRGIDLGVERGELIVLLGPSGCGKTTTLRMIAGLELATLGSIQLAGEDVTRLRPSRRDVGMVFQFYALYPHLTVRENIAFPLRAARLGNTEIENRVQSVTTRMQLEPLLTRYPKQLSGGDQQKVALARAMVRRPALYLMDEPLGTLDADQRLALRELIRGEQLASKVTTLYVTHDQEEAMSLADRIVVMEGGRIRQIGTPEQVYSRPADLFVAQFVGSPGMNRIAGEVVELAGTRCFVSTLGGVRISLEQPWPCGRATLAIRSEHIHEHPEGEIQGTVQAEDYLGSSSNLHVTTEFGPLIVRSSGAVSHVRGSRLRMALELEQISIFDAASEQRL